MNEKKFLTRLIVTGISLVLTGLFGVGINYFALPAINIHSSGFWWFAMFLVVLEVVFAKGINGILKIIIDDNDTEREFLVPAFFTVVLLGAVVAFFVTSISGWKLGHADQYANIIEVKESNFEEDFKNASNSEDIIIVDMKTAQRLGDRVIGSIEHAAWFDVDDEYDLIKIGDEYYRISSIEYGGFFEWNRAKSAGIPGFVLVNAKTQEAKFVQLTQGMKYAPSAFFSYDLGRHLHNQYPTYILGKSFFEVDDDLNPYWITNVRTAQIGMRGAPVATSVLVTNAITGETNEYQMDQIPDWVDHANSVGYLMQLVEWHYRYSEGWWNPSKTNIFRTSYYYRDSSSKKDDNEYTPFDGYNSMVMNGEIWFYTGLTPENASETNVGFLLISPKTGEVRYYKADGAEESSAQLAAEGLVQNLGYSASFPTIINIDGEATYFMLLKDNAGLVQRYALCNFNQYSKVVQAESFEETVRLYKVKMGMESSTIEDTSIGNTEDIGVEQHEYFGLTGIVQMVSQAQVNGFTYYYFMVEGNELIFMSSIQNNNTQPIKLVQGASVNITYYETSESGVAIVKEITID